MSAVAEFLKKQPLFRCDRLNASITAIQCELNRNRADNLSKDIAALFSCQGCPGLGEQITKLEEIPVAKMCSVKGCAHSVHARGMCWKHERSVLGVNPATGFPLKAKIKAVVKPSTLAVIDSNIHTGPATFGKVINAEGAPASFGTDPVVVLALREDWFAKEQEWLVELSGLKPGQTIARAAQMIDALEGLVY